MVALALAGAPLVWALLVPSALVLVLLLGMPLAFVGDQLIVGLSPFVIVAIPLYLMAGQLLNVGGVVDFVFRSVGGGAGRSRRHLPAVNVGLSTALAGINGSALADATAVGGLTAPIMRKAGYTPGYIGALTAASSVIGPLVPPSIVFIYYGSVLSVPVGDLFAAGAVPGGLVALSLMAVVYLRPKEGDLDASPEGVSVPNSLQCSLRFWAILAAFPAVLLAMVVGVVSPTEGAALTVLVAAACVVLARLKPLAGASLQAAQRTAAQLADVLLLIAASNLLAAIILLDPSSARLVEELAAAPSTPLGALFTLNVLLLGLGAVLDTFPAIAVVSAIIPSLVEAHGLDPVHVGLVVVLNLMVGAVTPPVGLCLFASAKATGAPVREVLREVLPFVAVLVGVLVLVTVFPQISLLIPNYFHG